MSSKENCNESDEKRQVLMRISQASYQQLSDAARANKRSLSSEAALYVEERLAQTA